MNNNLDNEELDDNPVDEGQSNMNNFFFSLADDKKSEYVSWILGDCQM